jgi:hypothetical protein
MERFPPSNQESCMCVQIDTGPAAECPEVPDADRFEGQTRRRGR